ncbi:MAG: hypothetical protein COZ12_06615 [Deltaproteobacteria bacterium CG_4_10_14_3_um_filter_60_8]|nr:MAG: hypothetical protein COZ12_06615 [Deltaproteobacteria bacterium CG_4_10_14_3_um_filter_60_8]
MHARETTPRGAWRKQLVDEYRHLCWLYRLPLRPPVFEIMDNQSRAGAWSPGFDTLKIAVWLITDCTWDVVLEILKHEVSHQYVQQVMGRMDEVPHGPAFQEACDRLGVHPAFRTATGRIPRLLQRQGPHTGSGVLARIEKLFSLAQSANEHEAALAMQKANALLRKHNLERIGQQAATEYDYLIINLGKKRLAAYQRVIASLLKDFFYVNVVLSQQFDPKTLTSHRVIELIGARENLDVAEYVYRFLENRLPHLWQGFSQDTGVPAKERNSYFLGVLHGFRQKLQEQDRQDMASRGGAGAGELILANDPGLIRYCRWRHPRLRTIQHAGPRVYVNAYEAGQQEGRQLVIHKGVAGQAQGIGGLLPLP